MNARWKRVSRALALSMTVAALEIAFGGSGVHAADHKDAPGTTADHAADLADVYAWHGQTQNRLLAAVTFAGLATSPEGPTYDANVLSSAELHATAAAIEAASAEADLHATRPPAISPVLHKLHAPTRRSSMNGAQGPHDDEAHR